MPFGFIRRARVRRGALVVAASGCVAWACAGCRAPDGSELFEPYDFVTRGVGGASAASPPVSGAGGAAPGMGGGGGSVSGEGQGGAIGLAGTGGASAAVGGGVTDAGLDASPPEPSPPDAAADVVTAPPCLPEAEVCDGLDNDCDELVDEGAACPEDCGGFILVERRYVLCSESVSHESAVEACEAEGMRLAWIETPDENAGLVANIAAVAGVPAGNPELLTHIGGSDAEDEGEWFWIGTSDVPDGFQFWDGGPADDGGEPEDDAYANWADIEPNNQGSEDCAVLSVLGGPDREPGQWDDRSCDEDELPFVCEEP